MPPGGSADPRLLGRRDVLTIAATSTATAVAGCGGNTPASEPPGPVTLAGGLQCDNCGMVIGEHFGPNGEVFFETHTPSGHENPARFDSLAACLFPYYFGRRQRGWAAAAIYVTDYSSVEYERVTREGTTYVSSHTAAESLAPANTLQYVVGSSLAGAMGGDLFPFSRRADAAAVADEFDGRVVDFEAIDADLLDRVG